MATQINTPLISIIIVSYNDKPGLQRCLESLYKFHDDKIPFETILIDNNSSDDSVEMVKINYPQAILIQNKSNVGFSRALNQGVALAKGAYFLILNPDTECKEAMLESFIRKAEENHAVGIWGPKILNKNEESTRSCWPFPTVRSQVGEIFYCPWLQNNYKPGDLSQPKFYPDILSGAALFIRRDTMESLGGFDEQFFWMEDADFCMRASKKGIKKQFCYNLELIHYTGSSAGQFSTIAIANQVYSKIKFFKKHYSLIKTTIVLLLQIIHVLYKAILFSILAPVNITYRKKAYAYIYTLFHFHKIFDNYPVLFD